MNYTRSKFSHMRNKRVFFGVMCALHQKTPEKASGEMNVSHGIHEFS
jgi:hypothetical protein